MSEPLTVLAIGATGNIGRLVVGELLARGLHVRALVRDEAKARGILPDAVDLCRGDLATGDGLASAVDGVDAIVLTHGGETREVDYDGVRRVLEALGGRRPRIALMTSMASSRGGDQYGGLLNWKRRAERLVRAYGAPYTVVRPGWFEYQGPHENAVLLEQGDVTDVEVRRGVAKIHIAKTLVESLFSDAAIGKTFELFSQPGELQNDWDALFALLVPDDLIDLAGDRDGGVPLADEPGEVHGDIAAMRALAGG